MILLPDFHLYSYLVSLDYTCTFLEERILMFVTRKETHLCGWQLMVVTMMWFSCLCKQEQMWMLQIIGKLHLLCQHFAR